MNVPMYINLWLFHVSFVMATVALIAYSTPIFLVVFIPITIIFLIVQVNVYLYHLVLYANPLHFQGRILNRFSKDMDNIDVNVPMYINLWLFDISFVVATVVLIAYSTPIFLVVFVPITIIFLIVQVNVQICHIISPTHLPSPNAVSFTYIPQ